MKKFLILLKKEIRELLTLQVILPLIITSAMFGVLGNVINKEQEKAAQPVKITIINNDVGTATSEAAIRALKAANIDAEVLTNVDTDSTLDALRTSDKTALLVIPAGFEKSIADGVPQKVDLYTFARDFTLMGGRSYGTLTIALAATNQAFSNALIVQRLPGVDPTVLKNPIIPNEYVVVGKNMANVSPSLIMGFVTQQTMFIPIILFIVIVFSSQMVATAIANEKENKTLETLLTTPVSRTAIVVAKMAAAAIIALLSSGVYMIGFKNYIGGLTGGATATGQLGEVIKTLGLTFSAQHYILLGTSLFIGILLALAISLILGAFAEDVKSVAGLTTPIMIMVTIPYFLTMFIDINSLGTAAKYAIYAIPFSHIFLAAPNLFLQHYTPVILGILYEFVWFVVFVFIATKIFSTDKIVTMKLNFSKKKKSV